MFVIEYLSVYIMEHFVPAAILYNMWYNYFLFTMKYNKFLLYLYLY